MCSIIFKLFMNLIYNDQIFLFSCFSLHTEYYYSFHLTYHMFFRFSFINFIFIFRFIAIVSPFTVYSLFIAFNICNPFPSTVIIIIILNIF